MEAIQGQTFAIMHKIGPMVIFIVAKLYSYLSMKVLTFAVIYLTIANLSYDQKC